VSGVWSASGSMNEGRADDSTATLLTDGTVLIAGGEKGTAEIYDPVLGEFSQASDLSVARRAPTATLLKDGTVLVAGGFDGSAGLTSAEVYDPRTDSWAPTGAMYDGRFGHTATRLTDGRVLVVAGWNTESDALATAEIYDPNRRSWSSAGSLDRARAQHLAVRLSDGSVLVAGGEDSDGALASSEIFDPRLSSWTAAANMSHARSYAAAVLLADGTVLMAGGGYGGTHLSSAELFDPATATWTATNDLTEPRAQLVAVRLSDGRVLAAGGGQTNNPTAEIYDPQSGEWTPAGNMTTWRASPMLALLSDGKVFLAGGFAEDSTTTEVFDPTRGEPVASTPPWFSRCGPGCQGPIQAGTFTSQTFLPGLQMTVGDGWFSTADSSQQLQFDQAEDVLRMWRNPGASSPTGELLPGVERTPNGLVQWLVTNPNIDASEPTSTTVGGIPATTLTVKISNENVNVDPECPPGVRSCLIFIWVDLGNNLAIGYGEAVRLYLLRTQIDGSDETLVISLDAPSSQQLTELTALVQPILASVQIPNRNK